MSALIVVLFCLFINGLLSAFEMAFVNVGKAELKQLAKTGRRDSRILLKLRERPERTLSVLQIGITLVGAISAAVGGAGAEDALAPIFEARFGWSQHVAEGASIAVIVLPLTYFSVVIGELVPKTLALRNSMKIALFSSYWLALGDRVLGPIVTLLERSTKFFMRLIFPRMKTGGDTVDEPASINLSSLSHQHQEYVLNLFHIELKKLREIVVPWEQTTHVLVTNTIEEVLSVVIKNGHTRLPVMDGEKVVGILHAKEFLSFVSSGETGWTAIIREPLIARGSDGLLRTLRIMQERKKHMALVMEEERVAGIVTLEDIIEEVVGDIYDEDDDGNLRRLLARRKSRTR